MTISQNIQSAADKLIGPSAARVAGSGFSFGDGKAGESTPAFQFTEAERAAAAEALDNGGARTGLGRVLLIERAITEHRRGDVVGTVRKNGTKYAFTYARGKHVLIDTNPLRPAYKPATDADEAEIAGWPVVKA